MGDQTPNPKLLEQYFLPALLAVLLIIVITAVFTNGDEYNNTAELETNRRSVRKGRVVTRDWFSIEVVAVNKKTAREYNIPQGTRGVIVTEIEGARDVKMKLQEGDVICAVNGEPIKSVRSFRKASKEFDPEAGVLLDVNRNGYRMYVPISGKGGTFNAQSGQFLSPDRYEMTDVAPFMRQDMNIGGYSPPSGVAGKGIEGWINHNFSGKYYTCLKCGTLVPFTGGKKKKTVICPNCDAVMTRQLTAGIQTAFLNGNGNSEPSAKSGNYASAPPITTDAPMPHEYRGVCSRCHLIIDNRSSVR